MGVESLMIHKRINEAMTSYEYYKPNQLNLIIAFHGKKNN
jgi:hypothetical protein